MLFQLHVCIFGPCYSSFIWFTSQNKSLFILLIVASPQLIISWNMGVKSNLTSLLLNQFFSDWLLLANRRFKHQVVGLLSWKPELCARDYHINLVTPSASNSWVLEIYRSSVWFLSPRKLNNSGPIHFYVVNCKKNKIMPMYQIWLIF